MGRLSGILGDSPRLLSNSESFFQDVKKMLWVPLGG
jgi:hypothetical protein